MVCMSLRMSPRIYIQKTHFRKFFRLTNPATRKSNPKVFPRYMRRAAKATKLPTKPVIAWIQRNDEQTAELYLSSRPPRELPRHVTSPAVDCTNSWLRACGLVPASPVSQIAAGNVLSSQRVYQGLGGSFSLAWVG